MVNQFVFGIRNTNEMTFKSILISTVWFRSLTVCSCLDLRVHREVSKSDFNVVDAQRHLQHPLRQVQDKRVDQAWLRLQPRGQHTLQGTQLSKYFFNLKCTSNDKRPAEADWIYS